MKYFRILMITLFAFTLNFVFAQEEVASKTEEQTTISVKVKGVGCAEDIKMISGNVEKLEGVNSCKAIKKGATTTFEVKMGDANITKDAIYVAIEDTPGCEDPKSRPYKVKKSKK